MYCLVCNRYSGRKPLHTGCEQAIHSYEEEMRFKEEEDEQVARIERLAEK